jgi:hypothetical protein
MAESGMIDVANDSVAYSWFGLDNPLCGAQGRWRNDERYRQIGIGCEKLFRTILRDSSCSGRFGDGMSAMFLRVPGRRECDNKKQNEVPQGESSNGRNFRPAIRFLQL